jgi:hypothetical protein
VRVNASSPSGIVSSYRGRTSKGGKHKRIQRSLRKSLRKSKYPARTRSKK